MRPDITMRVATAADAAALFEIHQAAIRLQSAAHYSAQQMSIWFEGRSPAIYAPYIAASQIWLAERAGIILGFVGFLPGEVTLLYVRTDLMGQGLGRTLLALGVAKARDGHDGPIELAALLNAEGFYQHCGFVSIGRQTFQRGNPPIDFPVVLMRSLDP